MEVKKKGLTALSIVLGLALLGAACVRAIPTPTPTPIPEGASHLLDAMEKMPLKWAEEGIWFHDWERALDIAKAPEPRSVEEFLTLSEEEQKAYWQATAGIAPGPDVQIRMKDYLADWQEAFGFTMFQMDLAITPGIIYSEHARPAYIEGELEAATVQELLLGLGYKERQAAERTYYALGRDYSGDPKPPIAWAGNTLARVYVDESVLISAPATDMIEGVLETWAGEQPSVLENAGFARIGEAMWDTLSTAIMPRSAAFDTSRFMEGQRPQFKKQETWGTLHEWEVTGFGFGKDADGEKWYAISLFYPDSDTAEADASELVHRMETYESVYQDYPEHPFVDMEIVSTSHVSYEDGSVLTVRYRAPGATIPFGGGPHPVIWFELVAGRDLGFLVPQTD